MAKWRVIGVDQTTGKGRAVEVEAVSAKGAQLMANDMGIMVERVDPPGNTPAVDNLAQVLPTQPEHKKADSARALYESADDASAKASRRQIRKAESSHSPAKQGMSELRRSINRVGEIAFGVFLGMIMFTCIGPMIIAAVIGFVRGLI